MGLLFDVSPNFSTLKTHRFPSQKLQSLIFTHIQSFVLWWKGPALKEKLFVRSQNNQGVQGVEDGFNGTLKVEISLRFEEISTWQVVCVCPFPSRAAICEDPDFWMFQDLLVAETHHWICCGDPCGNCHGEKSCVFALTSKIQRCWSFTWNQSREVSLRIHRKELAVFSTWSADPLECIWFCEKRWLPLDTELTWLAKTARSLQKTAKMWEKMAETNTEAKLKITNLEAYGLELPPNSLGVEKGMTYQQE